VEVGNFFFLFCTINLWCATWVYVGPAVVFAVFDPFRLDFSKKQKTKSDCAFSVAAPHL